MTVFGRMRDLFRRKPLDERALRTREEVRRLKYDRRTLKMSQRSAAGRWDSSGRGGR